MIIIIGNQKGGAGKSTLTLLMANYLTTVKEMPVSVIDMDYQQSIYQKYEKAKVLEIVEFVKIENVVRIVNVVKILNVVIPFENGMILPQ